MTIKYSRIHPRLKRYNYLEKRFLGDRQRVPSLEDKAIKIIIDKGVTGILQSDLWKTLETTSREGSRLAVRLEKAGLIKRVKELVDGRWTFRLYATSDISKTELENTLEGCPCFTCSDLTRCGDLQSISPVFCSGLDHWLQKLSKKAFRNTSS